jgi:hypothetical protein
MKARLRILSVTLLLGFGIPAWAHHSFSAVFDAKSPIEASGTVTQVDWRNPHAWIYVDVEDDENNVVNWAFELGSPNGLRRSGWTRNSHRHQRLPCKGWIESGKPCDHYSCGRDRDFGKLEPLQLSREESRTRLRCFKSRVPQAV